MSNRTSTTPALLRASTYGPRGRGRLLNFLLVLLLLPLTAAGIVATASPASAAAAVSGVVDPQNGFPIWYEDAAGGRVEQCLNAADANCPPLLAAPGVFDPAQPVVFPTNFPPEVFYTFADASIPTAGCAASNIAAGNMTMRIAVEGAFLGGNPSPTDRMTFGRIRVKGTGLCPNTTYTFQEPFGTLSLPTNDLGAIIATVGTTNVGCVPTPGLPCDFSLATGSPVFGTAANGGFLKWDTGAPAGYLGDPAVPHTITGGTNGNVFTIEDPTGENAASTNQFLVGGKVAGSLQASLNPTDFGAVVDGTTGAPKTITVTNVDQAAVTLGAATFTGANAADFVNAGTGTCAVGTVLNRDQTCTYDVSLAPPAAAVAGPVTATLQVASTGGVRSPLNVTLNGSAKTAAQAATISLNAPSVAFGNVRVRETSPTQHIIVTNTGTSALTVTDVLFDQNTVPQYDNYRMILDTCLTNGSVAPGGTCTIDLQMAPLVPGAHPTAVIIRSNNSGGELSVPLTGTGFGGLGAVATTFTTLNDGFPDWYMDDQGSKLAQCVNPADPYCVVLPDAFYNPALPIAFPSNWPVEFFYHVATSDNIAIGDTTCGAGTGKAFMRSGIEGAFPPAGPVAGTQLVFGRIRFFVSGGGLCPNTDYVFTNPYGADRFTMDAAGGLRRKDATSDVGCLIGAVGTCDFSLALSSPVAGSTLRWDPAVVPAAPAGYQGDAKTLHKVVGAAYSPDGVTPANYFEIKRADNGLVVGKTDLFTVMGKYLGPLEAAPAAINFSTIAQGSTSPVLSSVITNTGINPVTIASVTKTGVDAAQFTVNGGTCVGAILAPNATCTVSASVAPTVAGPLSAQLLLNNNSYNSTIAVALSAVGGAPGATPLVSFAPRSVAFGTLHDGQASQVETVTVSNAGGQAGLVIHSVTITDANAADYHIVKNNCPTDLAPAVIPIDGSCTVDVAFAASAPGARAGALTINSNAPGVTSSAILSGTGVAAGPAQAAALDPRNGFPAWFQDGNGNRVEPCLENTGKCLLLADAGFNPNLPVSFPTNFPVEFFYSVADSQQIVTPGCPAAGIPAGTAVMRMALEGSFANGTPIAGDQITFARQRVTVVGGLCPNAPYTFVSPWGPFTVTTDANGSIKPAAGTVDTPVATSAAFSNGFPRWNPNQGAVATAGYLGEPATLHAITGGTYVPVGSGGAQQAFIIKDSAGNEVTRTSQFFVAGKAAGPLQGSTYALDFGNANVNTTTAPKTVTITNVGVATTITARSITGLNPGDYSISGGSCTVNSALAADRTCTIQVAFRPTTIGTRAAQLRITPASGADIVVSLTGVGNGVAAPAITATPGTLAFGTRNAGTSTVLSTVIRNSGSANLIVSATTINGAQAGDYTVVAAPTTPCPATRPFTLTPGTSCSLAVSFSPKGNGSRVGNLAITQNTSAPTTNVSLSGTGVVSTFTMSPSPVSFGTVKLGSTGSSTISVRNSGTIAFTLTSANIVTAAPAGTFSFAGPGCLNTVLASGKSCIITVSFKPATAGNYTGTLQVVGDSTTIPSPVSNSLSGTGK